MKVNFEGSLQNNSAEGGYIIRDWKGNWLRVGSSYDDCTSIIIAEARVLRDRVKEACAVGYRKLIIEGDKLVIIKALLGMASTPWQITNIIKGVCSWLKQVGQVEVKHIYREANMTAD